MTSNQALDFDSDGASAPRLVLADRHRSVLEHHAAQAYPEQCCGLLIGRRVADDGRPSEAERKLVERVLPAIRCAAAAAENRVAVSPEVMQAAERQAASRGGEVIGVYHSHPDRPAEPTADDLADAGADRSLVIVSVDDGQPVEVASWHLTDDGRSARREDVVEPGGAPGG